MPSTYSDKLRFELIADGEQDGTWGGTTNTNIGTLIEQAIAGLASVTHDDSADYSLTTSNGGSDEARCMMLTIGGTLTAARNVVCPTKSKLYVIYNGTTGGYAVTIKTSAGTGITVNNGERRIVYCDGTNVVEAVSALSSLALDTALPLTEGGTGATSASAARTALELVPGTDVQAYDAGLASIAGLTTAADRMIYTTASDTYAVATLTSYARTLLDDTTAGDARTTLGLGTAAIVNTGVSNGNVPAMDGTGYPAANGSQITNLNASNLASGTIPAARIPNASTTAVGGLETATSAEQVTGTATDKIVTPGVQHYHPSACKCWGIATVSGGTPTLRASYNVTSITDTGTGQLTVTVANDFSSVYYSVVTGTGASNASLLDLNVNSQAVGSFLVNSHRTDTNQNQDTGLDSYMWACYGTLA